jgi:hypothetical protein
MNSGLALLLQGVRAGACAGLIVLVISIGDLATPIKLKEVEAIPPRARTPMVMDVSKKRIWQNTTRIAERNPFHPLRTEQPPGVLAADAEQEAAKAVPRVTVTGTLRDGARWSAIIQPADGPPYLVSEGLRVDGFLVKRIKQGELTLKSSDTTILLRLQAER